MIRKQLMVMSLAACAFGTSFANEYRAPLVTERGPLRYDLTMKHDKWSIDTWSAMYSRTADRGFLKDGTSSKQLPGVIFGQEAFTIGQSFAQNSTVLSTGFFANQNPFFFLSQFSPVANYSDQGMALGGKFEYPVFENKGRIGVRAMVPFKTIALQRDDSDDCPFSGLNNSIVRGDAVLMTDSLGAKQVFSGINRYKLALLMQLRAPASNGTIQSAIVKLNAGTAGTRVASGFNGTQYNLPANVNNSITADPQGYAGQTIPMVIIRGNGSGGQAAPQFTVPCAVTVSTTGGFDAASNNDRVEFGVATTANPLTAPKVNGAPSTANDLLALDANLGNVTAANQARGFAFTEDRDYTNIANQPNFNTLWVTPVFDGAGRVPTPLAQAAVNAIEQQLQIYQSDVLCDLAQQGFVFQTYRSTGLGDLDVDLFYEHTFNENWRSEVWLGVRFPTGGSNRFCGNPYRLETGNGGHFELKLGANVGWQTPVNWLALKADLSYAVVLSATEQRAAAFQGATVYNIGPCTPAEVDWGYLTGHFEFNFYHPKSRRLSTTIGYEIYYKTEDNVSFKNKSVTNHFLGQVWADTNTVQGQASPASGTVKGDSFVDYPMLLDNKVGERDTQRVAHRIRSEMHWHAHKYWSLFTGGAYTFAGQNVFRESDIHAGLAVRY